MDRCNRTFTVSSTIWLQNVEFLGLEPIIGRLSPELMLVPALVLLAVIVGFLPALAAYRTDVAESLGK